VQGPAHDDARHAAGKKLSVERVKADRTPDYDCFYVYPTVSDQPRIQATRKVDAVLRSIALYQAARYSRGCRVFAPVYRQITLRGLLNPGEITERMRDEGYADVRAAWREYLQRHNKGRGVVLIGHSQGTFVLKRLVAEEIDPSAKERRRIISALLLGGNVEVASGRDTGGTFKNVPACRRAAQIGCVVAFSVFGETPPDEPRFGRSVHRRPARPVHEPRVARRRRDAAEHDLPDEAVRAGHDRPCDQHRRQRDPEGVDAVGRGRRRLPRLLLVGERLRRAADHAGRRGAPAQRVARRRLGAAPRRRERRARRARGARQDAGRRVRAAAVGGPPPARRSRAAATSAQRSRALNCVVFAAPPAAVGHTTATFARRRAASPRGPGGGSPAPREPAGQRPARYLCGLSLGHRTAADAPDARTCPGRSLTDTLSP
jgi:hypothetical protein